MSQILPGLSSLWSHMHNNHPLLLFFPSSHTVSPSHPVKTTLPQYLGGLDKVLTNLAVGYSHWVCPWTFLCSGSPWGSQWCLSPQITTRGPITPLPMDFVLAWHEVSGCSPNFHSWVVCRGCSAPAAEPWLMKPIQDDLVPLWKVLNCLVSLAAKTGCVTQSVNVKVKVNKTYREIC